MHYKNHQKIVERKHLEFLIGKQFGDTELYPRFGESPDLIIDVKGTTIGVEHTQLFLSHTGPPGLAPIAQETLQKKIVLKAWNIFRQHKLPSLWVIVTFEDATTYFGKDVDRTALMVATTVEQFLRKNPKEQVWYKLEAWRARRTTQEWPTGVVQIDVQLVPDPSLEVWGPGQSYMVPHLQVADIQTTIDAKNERVADYLRQCSHVWLLIVVDDGSQASHFDVDDDVLNYPFSTLFSRLFLLRRLHEELFELRVG